MKYVYVHVILTAEESADLEALFKAAKEDPQSKIADELADKMLVAIEKGKA